MRNILVIDDDRLVREATQILLRSRGFNVTAVQDGKSGIDAVRASRFDVAIVDLFMPGMDGLQVAKAIRQIDPDIRLIVASGFMFDGACPPMPGFEDMATEAGAVLTLYKPLRPNDVLNAIELAMGASQEAQYRAPDKLRRRPA